MGLTKTLCKRLLGSVIFVAVLLPILAAQGNPVRLRGPYKLRPNDIIRVKVYNEIVINDQVPVLPDGKVSIPFVGLIDAVGRSVDDLAEELVNKYRDKLNLKDPKVSVTLEVYAPIKAAVQGAVPRPDQYEFKPGDNILTLVTKGGGYIQNRCEPRRSMLFKAGTREVIPIDLYGLMMLGDQSQNYELEDGDVLQIPMLAEPVVNIQGAVQQPGSYPYHENMYLSELVSLARGPVPIRAKMSEVIVMRPKQGVPGQFEWYKANYVRLIKNFDATQNMQLKSGDLVYVSETKTPDTNQLSSIFNAVYFVNQFLTGGLFGFKLFGR